MKISDLMKTLTGDKTYLSGIKILEGEILRTFKEGIPLIPDEINSASQEVLQCIEDALDSQIINIEIPSIGNAIEEKTIEFNIKAVTNTYYEVVYKVIKINYDENNVEDKVFFDEKYTFISNYITFKDQVKYIEGNDENNKRYFVFQNKDNREKSILCPNF